MSRQRKTSTRQIKDAAEDERGASPLARAQAARNILRAIDNPFSSVPGNTPRYYRGALVKPKTE